jgi:hypothetical protein
MAIRWNFGFGSTVYIFAAAFVGAQEPSTTATVSVDQPLHFLTKDSGDVLLVSGLYRHCHSGTVRSCDRTFRNAAWAVESVACMADLPPRTHSAPSDGPQVIWDTSQRRPLTTVSHS